MIAFCASRASRPDRQANRAFTDLHQAFTKESLLSLRRPPDKFRAGWRLLEESLEGPRLDWYVHVRSLLRLLVRPCDQFSFKCALSVPVYLSAHSRSFLYVQTHTGTHLRRIFNIECV
jgi:hypothetical protein